MPSNYEKICEDNIHAYGERTHHLSFLGNLYADRTHFIFELLQNAEDAGASKVLFQLGEDKLEVLHDGRLFDEEDVRGICGVGEGTKAEDLSQIGKFGIGFKSVYAYTKTPEIYSGDESFRIKNIVRPYALKQRDTGEPWTTLFVFPFDKEDVEPTIACKEIGKRLCELSARTLLFLREIKEIEFRLPGDKVGIYLRGETPRGCAREVTVIGQNNGKEENQRWLIFKRRVDVPEPVCSRQVAVELGFLLHQNEKEEREEIVRIPDSSLVVFFPTEKETRFGFLIQGPYKTTPARDNIPKDNDWNATLVRETAYLIADALPQLRDLGLLSVALLNALPIRPDDFPEDNLFYPIFETVRKVLKENELLPADDGSFVSARNAKLASADWLRKLLKSDQLNLLFQKGYKWINSEITERGRPELWKYLRDNLKIDEVTPESFARKVNAAFFKDQSDQWMIEFYTQLPNQKGLWKKAPHYYLEDGPIRKKPFIRLQDGSHVSPFGVGDKPNAYLPVKKIIDARLPTVKSEIAFDDEVRRFLASDLKIPELDIVVEVIEHIVPKYESRNPPRKDEHLRDIEKINVAFQTASKEKIQNMRDALIKTPFIISRTSSPGNEMYRKPGVLYFPEPSLELYFSGNSDIGFISSIYQSALSEMFEKLGIRREVRVEKRKPEYNDYIIVRKYRSDHVRGLLGFDPGIKVEGLDTALSSPTPEKSLFIWNKIVLPNAECIRGTIEKSTRQDYTVSSKEEHISESFGVLLINNTWLPGKDGKLYRPSEISLEELPDQFERNEKLCDLLEMKKDTVEKLAKEAGIDRETLRFAQALVKYPDLIEEINKREAVQFPTRTVTDPERRQEKLTNQLLESPKKEFKKSERSVRTTRGAIDPPRWLREQYTNDKGQMVCQICKNEMPFKKRDGEYYFEAVEVFSNFSREHEAQFLALCPVCAAMYNEFVKKDQPAMAQLQKAFLNSSSPEIPLHLDSDSTIRFVESHWLDIKTILNREADSLE